MTVKKLSNRKRAFNDSLGDRARNSVHSQPENGGESMALGTFLNALREDERGTSAVELGLICALIVLAMLSALQGVAGETIAMWTRVHTASNKAINGG